MINICSSLYVKFSFKKDQESSESQHLLNQQIHKLKDELEAMHKRMGALKQQKDDEFRRLQEAHDKEVSELRNEMRQQSEKFENERVKEVGELELELKKQRERTIKLLAEKEAEIEYLSSPNRQQQQQKLKTMRAESIEKQANDDSSIVSSEYFIGFRYIQH